MQLTDEMIVNLGMHVGIPLMLLGLFMIIWNLAKTSKAGRLGTVMMFVVLGGGFVSFIIKEILVWLIGRHVG